MGLDIGSKTIGTALCDAGWSFATADRTIQRRKFSRDLELLRELIAAQQVRGLVAGLPRNLDGSASKQTQATLSFIRNLKILDLPILLWDERWSSIAVERDMIAADMSRARRAERIDAQAAAYILQGAIDALCG